MLKQLSIYAENKKGTVFKITNILQQGDINILGSVTNDSAEYGIIRMVVSDPYRAADILTKEGYLCKLTDVLGIEVKDEVGSLNHLMKDILDSNINVNYLYLSFNRNTGSPIMILHSEDISETDECLQGKGYISL